MTDKKALYDRSNLAKDRDALELGFEEMRRRCSAGGRKQETAGHSVKTNSSAGKQQRRVLADVLLEQDLFVWHFSPGTALCWPHYYSVTPPSSMIS